MQAANGATWIMIANSSEAHIYDLDHSQFIKGKIKIKLINSYQHPESRMKDSELTSDRMGSFRMGAQQGYASGHGSFSEPTDPKEHEAEVFAEQLIHSLEKGRVNNTYHHLILIAPPHFQGLLNKHMNKYISDMISEKIDKDYTKIPFLKLTEYIHEHLIDSSSAS